MERFYNDVDKLINSKAEDLYRDCCVAIIESNGLKENAIKASLKVVEMHINDDMVNPNRDELTTLIPALKSIANVLKSKGK